MLPLDEERALRNSLIHKLNADFTERGPFSRDQLMHYDVPGIGTLAVVDYSRGIRNPKGFAATLSVVSVADGPYPDEPLEGGLMRYSYRRGGAQGDNRKLRAAKDLGLPLILFLRPESNCYVPVAPVYVVVDEPDENRILLAVDESARAAFEAGDPQEAQREYASRQVEVRLHQRAFRGMVLRAYETQCAVCRFRHGRLLDAAHIIGDREPGGRAAVTNGLALCKMHHAAYDANILGIAPDLKVHINREMLLETDGPMLQYGLQQMHGSSIFSPQRSIDRAKPELLEMRFSEFLAAE